MTALHRPLALITALYTVLAAAPAAAAGPTPWVCQPGEDGWQCHREAPAGSAASAARQTASPPPTSSDDPNPPAGATAPSQLWDWVPASALSEAERCQLGPGCSGRYIEPPQHWPDAHLPRHQVPTRAQALRSEWRGEIIHLEGEVELVQGQRRVTARRAEMDQATGAALFEGEVRLREPGLLLAGERADLDTNTGLGSLRQARLLDYGSGARARADLLTRTSEHQASLERARYTQCTPDDEVWLLDARHLDLDDETGRGVARHAVLRAGGLPVLYTPWLSFPIDDRRQTGWLWPSFSSGEGGEIAAPYYLNLAPNYDATLTPRYLADRGAMLETELRHLAGFGATTLAAGMLPNDDLTGDDRWLFAGEHRGRIGRHLTTRVDYAKVSDMDYFRDLDVSSLDVRRQTHLDQAVVLGAGLGNWNGTLRAHQYQTIEELISKPYRRLPQLTVQRTTSGHNFRPDYSTLLQYTDFEHDDALRKGGTRITGKRIYGELGLTLPMHWSWGYVEPTVKWRHVQYSLDRLPLTPGSPLDDDRPASSTPQAILDAGLFFERDSRWFGHDLLQTLEPRMYYLYSRTRDQDHQPLFDTSRLTFSYQQLFRPFRFTGYDRLEDFDQLSLGATSRWVQRATGRELITASLGQIIYFSDREVEASWNPAALVREDNRRRRSELAGELRIQPADRLWLTASTLWDADQDVVNEGGFYLHYAGDGASDRLSPVFNLGYRYRRAQPGINRLTEDIEQVDASAVVPLGRRWSGFARFNYDLDGRRRLEDMLGLQFEDCCWLVRMVYQRAVEGDEWAAPGRRRVTRDHAIVFEFQLKGLGSLGSTAAGLLEESILGYRQRD